ncbi:MAG: NAD(P)-dependent oxidoreductase [Sulfolobales archaeon]
MVVLITGGGFIASHLARRILDEGEDIVILSRSRSKLLADIEDKIAYVIGDISRWDIVASVIKKYSPDYIYHTAALLSDEANKDPVAAFRVNIEGTMNLYELGRLHDVRMIIFISSLAIFSGPSIVNDDTPRNPVEPYGISKLFGELWGRYYAEKYGLDVRGLRGTWIFGPGRSKGSTAFSSLIIQKPAFGEPVTVPDLEGNWIYVKDFVDALITLSRSKDPKRRFYLVGGYNLSVRDVAKIVKEYIPNAQINIVPPEGPATLWPKAVDDRYFREDFNWKPKFDIRGAIADFIDELKKKPNIYK